VVGKVVVCVYIVVVQRKIMRSPRATIIRVKENEVDYLLKHLAFGISEDNDFWESLAPN